MEFKSTLFFASLNMKTLLSQSLSGIFYLPKKKLLRAHLYNFAHYNFHNSCVFLKRAIAGVRRASLVDFIGGDEKGSFVVRE